MVANRHAIRRPAALVALALSALVLQACASVQPRPAARPVAGYKIGKPYQVGGIWYVPREQPDYDAKGLASWYGAQFHMKATASGERFDMNLPSAAHTTLPLPSIVEVTNLDNGRRLKVRVNDRGPFVGDRIIDLSREAARELGFERQGLARVRVRYVGRADLPGDRATGRRYAAVTPPPAAFTPPIYTPPAYTPPAYTPRPVAAPVDVAALDRPAVPIWSPPEAPPPLIAAPAPVATATSAPLIAPAQVFRVQAGAFSDPLNARRAVDQLASAGPALIEPLERDGVTLYRVVLQAGADELEAEAVREQAVAVGFPDARVLAPF